uniref:Uncharacterized protein n=1 Tax=Panagrolaimus sp. JU765 TaxID=591449 RepID=A0AC34Q3Y0_9BILA
MKFVIFLCLISASFADYVSYASTSLAANEATCRVTLEKNVQLKVFYGISAIILIGSVLLCGVSVFVFAYVQRKLVKEMNETVFKAMDVMDAVMVSLVPRSLLMAIMHKEIKIEKNEKNE